MVHPANSIIVRRGDSPEEDSSAQPLDCAALCVILFFASILLLTIATSERPLVLLVVTLITILPIFLAGMFITRKIGDETLSRSFFFHQVWWGGCAAYIFAILAEALISVGIILLLFWGDFPRIHKYIPRDTFAKMSPEELLKAVHDFIASIPTWKLILLLILTAFVVPATVEEFAKLAVGRRAKSRVRITARTFVAGVLAGALGLAGTEHYTYTIVMFAHQSIGGAIFGSLFRACLAFPLHLGTAMIYGCAMAEYNIHREESNVFKAFSLAIFFRGSCGATWLLVNDFIVTRKVPMWTKYAGNCLNIVLVGVLMVTCRKRFNTLTAKARYDSVDGEAA